MDIGLTVFLVSIYKLAEASGLIDYIKKIPEKSADAILEKLVQDGQLPKCFSPELEKPFKAALEGIAPFDKDTLRYQLILNLLTAPEIIHALESLRRGQLPQRQILVPVFQIVLPGENASRIVDLFIDNLYNELKKDQETVNLVMLVLAEKMAGQQAFLEEIREAIKTLQPPLQKDPFKISLTKLPIISPDLYGREKELAIDNNSVSLIGDSKRQAIPPLRGYAYQIWQSVYKWVTLKENEVLFLEGAEDVDLLGPGKAETIQIKDLQKSITLRSEEILKAIVHFWEHQSNNPQIKIIFRFLTTANRGKEIKSPFGDQCGLDYWDYCKRPGAKLAPLRNFLKSQKKNSNRITSFCL